MTKEDFNTLEDEYYEIWKFFNWTDNTEEMPQEEIDKLNERKNELERKLKDMINMEVIPKRRIEQ